MYTSMTIKIVLPTGVLTERKDILRIIMETRSGSFGIWPNRLDCVTALVPGVLSFENRQEGMIYAAIDEGIFVKTGQQVTVSVRKAIVGKELGKLRESVEHEILNLEEKERGLRTVLAKLENGFIRNFQELITT